MYWGYQLQRLHKLMQIPRSCRWYQQPAAALEAHAGAWLWMPASPALPFPPGPAPLPGKRGRGFMRTGSSRPGRREGSCCSCCGSTSRMASCALAGAGSVRHGASPRQANTPTPVHVSSQLAGSEITSSLVKREDLHVRLSPHRTQEASEVNTCLPAIVQQSVSAWHACILWRSITFSMDAEGCEDVHSMRWSQCQGCKRTCWTRMVAHGNSGDPADRHMP